MLELGKQSPSLHAAAAKQMLTAGFDHIILVGQEVLASARHLEEQGFTSFFHSADKSASVAHFLSEISAGDLVYLKGSRGMQLETFINAYKEQN